MTATGSAALATTQRHGLRADIQGLRALAVALVVIFHLSPQLLRGGYIGVDVFFVISGYLIIGHLLREVHETGRLRIGRFWARRARRLLPAAFTVLLVSLIIVWTLLPVTSRHQNFTEIGFAAGYILNWRLSAMAVDYLGADNQPSIAQHFWSLSVEEQFYLIWPILILIALLLARAIFSVAMSSRTSASRGDKIELARLRRAAIIAVLLLVAVGSLLASILMTAESQPSAYFATTTRAWEFAIGGLICALPVCRIPAAPRALLSWLGLAAILVAAAMFSAETAFPGWIALVPVLGTAAAIWLGAASDEGSDDSASGPAAWAPQRWSDARWIRYLGDVSYSIYLWHWPLIIAAVAVLGGAPGPLASGVIIIATLLLAGATKRWIEDPVRRAPGVLRRTAPTFGLVAAGMAALLVLTVGPILADQQRADASTAQGLASAKDPSGCFGAYALFNGCAHPYRAGPAIDPLAAQVGYITRTPDAKFCTARDVANRQEITCELVPDTPAAARIAFVGDSHAEHLLEPMLQAAERQGWALSVRTRGGCSSLEQPAQGDGPDHRRRCQQWGSAVLDELRNDASIDAVVISLRPASKHADTAYASEVMQSLQEAGKRVVFIRDVPGTQYADAPNGAKAEHRAQTGPECVAAAKTREDPCAFPESATSDWALDAARSVDATILDTHEVLCRSGSCHVVIGDTIVYGDSNHLAVPFAMTLAPWLAEGIGAALAH